MSCSSSRTSVAWALAGLATWFSFPASAQSLSSADFSYALEYYGQNRWIQMNTTEQTYFFNRARCECVGDRSNYSGHFRIAIRPSPGTADKIKMLLGQNLGGNGVARLYAGTNVVNCLSPASAIVGTYANFCLNLVDPGDVSAGIEGGMVAFAQTLVWYSNPIPAAWLFNVVNYPVCSGGTCNATESCGSLPWSTVIIYFWAQTGARPTPDMQDSSFTVTLADKTALKPDNVTAVGGDGSVTVSWGWPSGLDPASSASFLGVQILCARNQSDQVFQSGNFVPAYMTSARLCPGVAPVPTDPQPFGNLDSAYLCSDLLPPTTTSHRIRGLQNGVPYVVGVVGVDKWGNVTPLAGTEVVYQVAGAGGAAGTLGGQGGAVVDQPVGQLGVVDGGPANSVHLAHGCSCRVDHNEPGRAYDGLVLLGLAVLSFRRRRTRPNKTT